MCFDPELWVYFELNLFWAHSCGFTKDGRIHSCISCQAWLRTGSPRSGVGCSAACWSLPGQRDSQCSLRCLPGSHCFHTRIPTESFPGWAFHNSVFNPNFGVYPVQASPLPYKFRRKVGQRDGGRDEGKKSCFWTFHDDESWIDRAQPAG